MATNGCSREKIKIKIKKIKKKKERERESYVEMVLSSLSDVSLTKSVEVLHHATVTSEPDK